MRLAISASEEANELDRHVRLIPLGFPKPLRIQGVEAPALLDVC
jgi:hypothetical protein